jgi:hypothetical protein
MGRELGGRADAREPTGEAAADEAELGLLDQPLADVGVERGMRKVTYVGSSTRSHAFAVGCDTPTSPASAESFSS